MLLVFGCDSVDPQPANSPPDKAPVSTEEDVIVRDGVLLEWDGYSSGMVEMTSLGWVRHNFGDQRGVLSDPVSRAFQDSILIGFRDIDRVTFSSGCTAYSTITIRKWTEGRIVEKQGPRCGIDESDSLQVIVGAAWQSLIDLARELRYGKREVPRTD